MLIGDQPRPYAVWLAHHKLHLYVLYTLVLCGLLMWPHNPVIWWTYPAALAGMWAAMIGDIRHDTVMCYRCVAEFPVDGATRALHATRRLRYFHARRGARFFGALLLGVAVSLWWGWFQVPVCVWMCFDTASSVAHRRLAWWCPWCRDDHGGGIDCVPPVPTEVNSR